MKNIEELRKIILPEFIVTEADKSSSKPIKEIAKRFNMSPKNILIVGDKPYEDGLCAEKSGAYFLLVLTRFREHRDLSRLKSYIGSISGIWDLDKKILLLKKHNIKAIVSDLDHTLWDIFDITLNAIKTVVKEYGGNFSFTKEEIWEINKNCYTDKHKQKDAGILASIIVLLSRGVLKKDDLKNNQYAIDLYNIARKRTDDSRLIEMMRVCQKQISDRKRAFPIYRKIEARMYQNLKVIDKRIYPGAIDALKKVKKAGFKIGIITGKPILTLVKIWPELKK